MALSMREEQTVPLQGKTAQLVIRCGDGQPAAEILRSNGSRFRNHKVYRRKCATAEYVTT